VDKNGTGYTLVFAAVVTIICAVLLGFAATKLKPLQDKNADVDKKSKILLAVGEFNPEKKISNDDVLNFFKPVGTDGKFVVKFAINHAGEEVKDITEKELKELELQPQMKKFPDVKKDEAKTAENAAKRRYPIYAFYGTKEAFDAKKPTNYIIPVFGYGLWSNCYGVLALDSEGKTVKNLVYYKHGETPGLGGEIEKKYFSDRFIGQKVHNAKGEIALTTTKGDTNENSVQAISGATFTMDGVNKMLKDFLTIYDVYLAKQREVK
jgi:Na+-transporting NADH:ubiquinone oxidoreductase subunit C